MNTTEVLNSLCSQAGVSGGEFPASKCALQLLKNYTENAKIDDFGNVIGYLGEDESKPLILLDAHIDQIGFTVTYICDDGFLKVGKCGGIDVRTLLAQTVTIHGKETLKGVISTLPPHVAKEKDKAAKLEDIVIDTGLSGERAKELISQGDFVTVDGRFSVLAGNRVCSPATDDRAGVVSLLYALEILKEDKELPFRVAVQFAAQEEVGGRGARIAAFNIDPDYAIAVDVSFAQSKGVDPSKCGKLGKGPMIGIAASLDRKISAGLIETAKSAEIPYQTEVMGGDSGTDADDISVSRGGVRTGLVSVPQRYMHTPCEVLDIADIENTGRLIAEFIKKGVC